MRKITLRWITVLGCLLAFLAAGTSAFAQGAEETGILEVYVEDVFGQGLARASVTNGLRSASSDDWSYGDQLTGDVALIYDALVANTDRMLSVTSASPLKVALETPFQFSEETVTANTYTETETYTAFKETWDKAVSAYIKDYTKNYWIRGFIGRYTPPSKSNGYRITSISLYPIEYYDGVTSEISDTNAALSAAIAAVDGENNYEIIKSAHDYVADLVTYASSDTTPKYYHTITGGLLEKYSHTGVCECYAKLFQLICQAKGIPCVLITGGSTTNADGTVKATHMWNYVKLGRSWYLVDVTWDDTLSNKYGYFLVGSDTVVNGKTAGATHMAVGRFSTSSTYTAFTLPTLSSVAYEACGVNKPHEPGLEATCTEAQTCINCGEVLVEALGHEPGAEATCTEAQTCTRCGEELEPALGHEPGTEATCTTDQTCERCGEVLTKALGHEPGAEATCGKDQTCTRCGEVLTKATGDHTAGAKATCTTDQTCTVCGKVLAKATGHTAGSWKVTKKATGTSTGKKEQRCTVCNKVLKTATIAKTAVKLNASSLTMQKGKCSTALKASGLSSGDSVAKWTSSNSKIVAVNSKTGKLTAKKTGKAKITVTTKTGAKASCVITVKNAVVKTQKLTLSKTSVTLKKGKTMKISVTRTPLTATDKITFKSSNTSIVTVNSNGKVTAKKKGTAKIVIKAASGAKVTLKITVN